MGWGWGYVGEGGLRWGWEGGLYVRNWSKMLFAVFGDFLENY